MSDEQWMDRAIARARKGRVSPNPQVGAVLVEDGRVLGEGFHEVRGGAHAERNAIDDAVRRSGTSRFPNATLYCTLEPCCYTHPSKRQPPCTSAIIEAGISRVVLAHRDPNPNVRGRGCDLLRKQGIVVETGCRRQAAQELNSGFITRMLSGKPHVRIKLAQSVDGRIASITGDSRWISDEQARRRVHEMRAASDALMVGTGTIRADNPRLDVRHVEGANPRIIIPDPLLSVSPESRAVKEGTVIFHIADAPGERRSLFEESGAELCELPQPNQQADQQPNPQENRQNDKQKNPQPNRQADRISLNDMLLELGRRQINTLLVEGGAGIATSLIREGLFDELILFIAPMLIGRGLAGIGELGIRNVEESERLSHVSWEVIGDQVMFRGRRRGAVCLQEL
ncbi:MAG: bifunctional diaminohydroxyphosphoribosylaminopyrimidine deaminase/5-amino-6-(5-phosphoribosylamino)uracil reductase RibD [Salinispira sp.]